MVHVIVIVHASYISYVYMICMTHVVWICQYDKYEACGINVSIWYVWSMWYECVNMICMTHVVWIYQYDMYKACGMNVSICYVWSMWYEYVYVVWIRQYDMYEACVMNVSLWSGWPLRFPIFQIFPIGNKFSYWISYHRNLYS